MSGAELPQRTRQEEHSICWTWNLWRVGINILMYPLLTVFEHSDIRFIAKSTESCYAGNTRDVRCTSAWIFEHKGLSDFQSYKSFRWEAVFKNLQSLYQSDQHSLELLRPWRFLMLLHDASYWMNMWSDLLGSVHPFACHWSPIIISISQRQQNNSLISFVFPSS